MTRRAITAEERAARREALLERLNKMNAIEKAEAAARWNGCTINGHYLSENNRILLAIQAELQNITLSEVGGFRQWKEHGRKVARSQKGMIIFFPMKLKMKKAITADGNESSETSADSSTASDGVQCGGVRFKAVCVFDRSQTEEMSAAEMAEFRRRGNCEKSAEKDAEIIKQAAGASIPERVKKAAPDFAALVAAKIKAALVA